MVSSKSQKPTTPAAGSGRGVFRAIPVNAVVAKVQNSAKANASKKKHIPKSQRQNRKGWMDGLREELICPLIPAYVDALEISKAAGALKMKELQHLFHTYFPWPLADWEEPPRPLNKYDPLAPLPAPVDLTPERAVMWANHMNCINKRLERWVKWRIGMAPRGVQTLRKEPNDAATLMLAEMLGVGGSKKQVRARTGAQQYQHDEYAASGMEAAVEAEFAKRADMSVTKVPLALTQRIAKEFFEKLPKEKKEAWVAKAKAEAAAERARNKSVLDAEPTPAMMATCVRNTPSILSKVSRRLDTFAGLKTFTMVAGPMGMYDGQVGYFDVTTTRNNGGTGMSFMEWLGPERANDLVEAYMIYVETCVSESEKTRVISHDGTVPDWGRTHIAINNAETRTASFRAVGDADDDDDDDESDDDDDDSNTRSSDDTVGRPGRKMRRSSKKTLHASPATTATASPDVSAPVVEMGASPTVARPRPRPAWNTQRADDEFPGEDVENSAAELKKAALVTLRKKRARRRAPEDSDNEMGEGEEGEDEARHHKRQRRVLEDVSNMVLPPEPGMDTGRFFVPATPMAPSSPPSPAPEPTPACPPARTPSPAPEPTPAYSPARTPSPAPEPGPSPPGGLTPACPAARGSDDRPMTPTALSHDDLTNRLTSEEAASVQWLVEPVKEFLAAEGGLDMLKVLDRLWRLESQYVGLGMNPRKRATLPRGKNADGSERLKMLGDWVAGGRTRRGRMVIDRKALQKFTKEWHAWWDSLQPDWRKKSRGSYARDNVFGGFEVMTVPGANGMLSVVATLSWWRSAVGGRASEQWLAALIDVEWVIDKLMEATRSSDGGLSS